MAAPRTTHSPPYTTLITFTPSSPPPPSLSSSSPLHPHRNHCTDTTTSTISFTPPPSRRHCYHRCLVTLPPPAGTKGACGLSAAPQGCVWFGFFSAPRVHVGSRSAPRDSLVLQPRLGCVRLLTAAQESAFGWFGSTSGAFGSVDSSPKGALVWFVLAPTVRDESNALRIIRS
ncbi:hypothetical protein Tco_0884653 [Tanacetum coccineum]